MRNRLALVVLAAAVVLTLAGCTGPAGDDAAPPAAPTQTISVSLDGLSVLDAKGDPTAHVAFTDGAAVLALLEDRLGQPTKTIKPEGSPVGNYDWGAVALLVQEGGPAAISFLAPDFEGYALRTAEGVSVSTPLDAAQAMGATADADADVDGDGSPDSLVMQRREVAGTVSKTTPGQVGVEYISLRIQNGMVTGLRVPTNDFGDI